MLQGRLDFALFYPAKNRLFNQLFSQNPPAPKQKPVTKRKENSGENWVEQRDALSQHPVVVPRDWYAILGLLCAFVMVEVVRGCRI